MSKVPPWLRKTAVRIEYAPDKVTEFVITGALRPPAGYCEICERWTLDRFYDPKRHLVASLKNDDRDNAPRVARVWGRGRVRIRDDARAREISPTPVDRPQVQNGLMCYIHTTRSRR